MNEEDYCFGYSTEKGDCMVLTEQSLYCNSPKCPFYKTHERMRREIQQVKKRHEYLGLNYDFYYKKR